jgi:putative ABC transport system permease protein
LSHKNWFYTFPLRIRTLFRRSKVEQELNEELRYHIERQIEEHIARGMTPAEARLVALRALGGVEQRKEECRDMRGLNIFENLLRDIRYGLSMLWKNPGFTVVAILTLALGVGANTAIFSVTNATLLQPYSYIDVDRWVIFSERNDAKGLEGVAPSIPNFRDWRRHSQSFSEMVLWTQYNFNLSGSGVGEPERVRLTLVTTNLFSAHKLIPAAGRLFIPEDAKSDDRLAVISYELWQRRFGGDLTLLGRKIYLNYRPYSVVGIAPSGFSFPLQNQTDVWIAYPQSEIDNATDRAGRGVGVLGMLKAGVSLAAAQTEMDVIAGRLASQYPEDKDFGVELTGYRESLAGDFRRPLLLLFGALGLVLLLACINLANLQLVRLESRRHELAVRAALGASAGRLLRQLLTESMLLVVVAGALGTLLAPLGVKALLWTVSPDRIPWLKVKTDGSVLLLSLGVTALAAVMAGLAPAIKATRFELTGALGVARGFASGSGAALSRRWRNAFLIFQIVFALAPLSAAALLVNSFVRLSRVDPGFETGNRLTLSYFAPLLRYKDSAAVAQLAERLSEKLRQSPAIKAAGGAQYVPFAPAVGWAQAVSRTRPQGNPADLPHVSYTVATTGYLESLGVRLKAGRLFTSVDSADAAPVVLINEATAKQFFPNENPIGQSIWIGHAQALPNSPSRTIVGVIGDTLRDRLDVSPRAAAWVPITQQGPGELLWRNLFLVIHTATEPLGALPAIRKEIASIDPDLALSDIFTLEDHLDRSLWRQRFTAGVISVFSLVALAIAALGVYGVASYLVKQRTREIGVRMALGATPRNILRLMMREGAFSILIGVVAGIASSLAFNRFLGDPFSIFSTALLLALVALAACLIPARRATKVDPMTALRAE